MIYIHILQDAYLRSSKHDPTARSGVYLNIYHAQQGVYIAFM